MGYFIIFVVTQYFHKQMSPDGMLPKTNDKWSSTKASQHARQTVIVIWKCVPFPL